MIIYRWAIPDEILPGDREVPNSKVKKAYLLGASGYVLKQSAGDELLLAVRKVNRGESYLSPLIAKETVTFLLASS